MTDFKERLVLKQPVDSSDVSQIGWDFDWDLYDIGDTSKEPYVDVWFTQDHSVEIHYVEDRLAGLNYITLRGNDVTPVSQQIRERCALWSPEDALQTLRRATNRDDKLRAIYAAALSASGSQNDVLIEEFRAIASNEGAPGIRQAVVVATGYLPWQQLVQLVADMRDSDPADHIRHNAQVLLDGLRLHPPGTEAES